MNKKLKQEAYQGVLERQEEKEHSRNKLRGMELQAYSSFMEALRADGRLDKEKKTIMEQMRKYFHVSEQRHLAEIRRVNSQPDILEVAGGLREDCEEIVDESWTVDAYDVFPPLPAFRKRIGPRLDPFPLVEDKWDKMVAKLKDDGMCMDGLYQVEENVEFVEDKQVKKAERDWQDKFAKRKVYRKINNMVKSERDGSPDIIDAASTTIKNERLRPRQAVLNAKLKKKVVPTQNSEFSNHRKGNSRMNKTPNKVAAKPQRKFGKIKFTRRRPPPPEPEYETEEEEEEEPKARMASPVRPGIKIKSPSPLPAAAARGAATGHGFRGRTLNRGRGRASIMTNQVVNYKTKPKKPAVSLSRRKSKLREKVDDDMQMEWNGDDDDEEDDAGTIISNRHVLIQKRRLLQEEDSGLGEEGMTSSGSSAGTSRRQLQNGESHHRHYYNNYLSPVEIHQMTRSDMSQKSPQLSGEETDSASEKGSITGGSRATNSSHAGSPPPPPTRQKQRLKSPLIPTQLPRISVPPPIFSTSLNNSQKKQRQQKHVSVVDSLNLHLPTTPTASSLASSTRRPFLGSGPGIFSNQALILARAGSGSGGVGVGTPGLLQSSQRKPTTPHILATKRTFIPSATSSANNSTIVNPHQAMGLNMAGGATITLANNYPIVNNTIITSTSILPNTPGLVHHQLPTSSTTQLTMAGGLSLSTRVPTTPTPLILMQKKGNAPTPTTPTSISNTILFNLTRIQDE